MNPINRRHLLQQGALGAAALALGATGCVKIPQAPPVETDPILPQPEIPADYLNQAPQGPLPDYRGPNVVLIRFGGGVRRLETVTEPEKTYCPFVLHELAAKHGTLFPKIEITGEQGVDTSHGQGTLYLLTGQYHKYKDIGTKFLGARFEAKAPTLFEYLRRSYNVPEHQALIVNGEDRIDEEFYTFSNHHMFGVQYRSTVLSLYRFKTYKLWRELKEGKLNEKEYAEGLKKFHEMERLDYRITPRDDESVKKDQYWASKELDQFWDRWTRYYGTSGLVNPRGDRLLTELSLWAMKELKPRLMMINYNDPDYVHWGPASFYTRAISIIDEGIKQLWNATQADEYYRDNTVFVIVPDCGRDTARGAAIPFQHHFNSRSSREIFAVVAGPKKYVPQGLVVDKVRQQIRTTATVGQLMGFKTPFTQVGPLAEGVA